MLVSDFRLRAIQDFLESVTGDCYRRKIAENTPQSLLVAWQSDTRIDYAVHVMLRPTGYRVAFAVMRNRDIETRFDRTLCDLQFRRLIGDPRLCVMYLVGQIRD